MLDAFPANLLKYYGYFSFLFHLFTGDTQAGKYIVKLWIPSDVSSMWAMYELYLLPSRVFFLVDNKFSLLFVTYFYSDKVFKWQDKYISISKILLSHCITAIKIDFESHWPMAFIFFSEDYISLKATHTINCLHDIFLSFLICIRIYFYIYVTVKY